MLHKKKIKTIIITPCIFFIKEKQTFIQITIIFLLKTQLHFYLKWKSDCENIISLRSILSKLKKSFNQKSWETEKDKCNLSEVKNPSINSG